MTWVFVRRVHVCALAVIVAILLAARPGAQKAESDARADLAASSLRITSPLGRTGIATTMHIVAKIDVPPGVTLSPVEFFVDAKPVGSVSDGPPYVVIWTDDNPYERREITVQASDSTGRVLKDTIVLEPFEVVDRTQVTAVVLETSVYDKNGRFANNFDPAAFTVLEDKAPQAIEYVARESIPSDLVLLVDNSQSMARRMDFVRLAVERLSVGLRDRDRVIVAPFSARVGTVTGPTNDKTTIADAITGMRAGGGSAVLDSLVDATKLLEGFEGRRGIVLITDGYDENSKMPVDDIMRAVEDSQCTVYAVGIGGIAGISLRGETILRKIAERTGGRAFFPLRDQDLLEAAQTIGTDARSRYLITYTPSNQRTDGAWREVTVNVPAGYRARTRAGYFSPAPTPIQPRIEFTIKDGLRRYLDVGPTDFEVFEDGAAQTVTAFQEAVDPVSIVLALDSSGSMKKAADLVRTTAKEFVSAVRPEDRLAFLTFADKSKLAHAFTTVREWSFDAVDKYVANGGTALYDALWDSFKTVQDVNGRRAVVVLSDGRDENNPGTAPGSVHTLDEVLGLARKANAPVFAVALGAKVDTAVLDRLTQETGGQVYVASDAQGLNEQFRQVVLDLRKRYVLSYTSTNAIHDGAWRTVEIRPKASGRLIVSAGGYWAPDK